MKYFTKHKVLKRVLNSRDRFYLRQVAIGDINSSMGNIFSNKQLYIYGYYLDACNVIYRIVYGPIYLVYWYNGNNLLPHSLVMSEII